MGLVRRASSALRSPFRSLSSLSLFSCSSRPLTSGADSSASHVVHLPGASNQALGIARFAVDFIRGGSGSPDDEVFRRTQLFYTDASVCGAREGRLGGGDRGRAGTGVEEYRIDRREVAAPDDLKGRAYRDGLDPGPTSEYKKLPDARCRRPTACYYCPSISISLSRRHTPLAAVQALPLWPAAPMRPHSCAGRPSRTTHSRPRPATAAGAPR